MQSARLGTRRFQPQRVHGIGMILDMADHGSITEAAGVVSAIADRSTNGSARDLSASANGFPTTLARTIGGKNAVDFTPNDDINRTDFVMDNTSGFTSYVTVEFDTASDVAVWAEANTANNADLLQHSGSTSIAEGSYREGTGAFNYQFSVATRPLQVSTFMDDTANASVVSNGVAATATYSNTRPVSVNIFALGALVRLSDANFLDGAIGDVIIVLRPQSRHEQVKMERYLSRKRGIPIP
jgi:hypothetical protein